MSQPTDPVAAEKEMLRAARQRGGLAVLSTYVKCSGPGWLQGAITLGGGSLAGSLYLGVLGGYSLLWLQVLAMVFGVIMLSAITYVTLSTGKSPFRAINEHINPVLGWGWALATLTANVVWCLPQFSLGVAAVQQNLVPALGAPEHRWIICAALLGVAGTIVWFYDSGGGGIKLFELILKIMVAGVVLCFFGVVIKLSLSGGGLDWSAVLNGFKPNLNSLTEPAAAFLPALEATGAHAAFWKDIVVSQKRDVIITAVATAVGINMTFLLPYSMLKKGWDKESRGLAIFDLGTGLFIPFVLATGCVVIAAASQFHARPAAQALDGSDPKMVGMAEDFLKRRLSSEIGVAKMAELSRLSEVGVTAASNLENLDLSAEQRESLGKLAPLATALQDRLAQLPEADKRMAAMLVKRDSFHLASALEGFTGKTFAHYVFGIGVLGMAVSTIIILMLISGFTICEVFGLPHGGLTHRIGCFLPAIGVLGPFFYSGKTQFWLAVPTSNFGMALLPIAYLSFFLLMNNRQVMGEEKLSGIKGALINLLMLTALGAATFCAGWAVWSNTKWIGVGIVAAFGLLAWFVHLARQQKAELAAASAAPVVAVKDATPAVVKTGPKAVVAKPVAAPTAAKPEEDRGQTVLLKREMFEARPAAPATPSDDQGQTVLLKREMFHAQPAVAAPAPAADEGQTVFVKPEMLKPEAASVSLMKPKTDLPTPAASPADEGQTVFVRPEVVGARKVDPAITRPAMPAVKPKIALKPVAKPAAHATGGAASGSPATPPAHYEPQTLLGLPLLT